MRIAIVGAGMAGLSVAAKLAAAGQDVALFDKGRGPGGRMSTRRVTLTGSDVSFDHGAQYFTARSAEFSAAVAGWKAVGHVAEWRPRTTPALRGPVYTGVPAMSSLVRYLAAPFAVRWGTEVSSIVPGEGGWKLALGDAGAAGPFDQVVIAVPAEQAARLLDGVAPCLAAGARHVRSLPCWAALLAFDHPVGVDWDVSACADNAAAWTARNSSKPGRTGRDAWVVHASPGWSKAHLEDAPEAVALALTDIFRKRTDAPAPDFAAAHRWRLARVADPFGNPFQYDSALGLGTCGDWHLGARIEAAWLSGAALGAEMLR